MTSASNGQQTMHPKGILKWSEIDKVKFFGIGTGMYSALTVMLHPITVLKTRQQVLNTAVNTAVKVKGDFRQHQPSLGATFKDVVRSSGARGLYRGLGVVVALAIPARVVYIGVLEGSRQDLSSTLSEMVLQSYAGPEEAHAMLPLVSTVSGGLAGGLAAVSAQIFVVPMDVVSQKQMVMKANQYAQEGSARAVARSVIQTDGWKGLFRGFGLSIFNSLPTGTVWWATYSGCQHWLQSNIWIHHTSTDLATQLGQQGVTQLFSGLGAALVASSLTQPLDVVKTRLQVGSFSLSTSVPSVPASSSPMTVARELLLESGPRGFFRGLGPRILHMGVWGTVLSSAYELLRHISRKSPPRF